MHCFKNNQSIDNERLKKAEQLKDEIVKCLHTTSSRLSDRDEDAVIVAYVLSKVAGSDDISDSVYPELNRTDIDEDIMCSFKEIVNDEMWRALSKLVSQYSAEEFIVVTLLPMRDSSWDCCTTPTSIIKLAQRILQCQSGESVVDIGCGTGTFLMTIADEIPDIQLIGYEINVKRIVVSSIRAKASGHKIDFRLKDAFSIFDEDNSREHYDKVFSNYPFGMKLHSLGRGVKYLDRLSEMIPGISKATSSDWVFNALMCELIKPDGKAVGIMTNGGTWNRIDTPVRRYFIEQGLIESVISLPGRMFGYTNIPTSLIVFSCGNHSIRLVDASKICQQGRRMNEFSDEDINIICSALTTDSEISKEVTWEELRENDFTLSLSRYIHTDITFDDAAPFENVIKSITRGAPCTAKQLDEIVSYDVTNMQYLMLANIKNGIIDEKLPYLSSIEPRFDKYCLKNNNLILSKNGYPYKVAVAKVREGQKILANGNLYIIEIDEEKANPYYLKAFFESEQGIAVLNSITVGATIPNIGVENLKKLMIPLPSLEEQERIAQKYQAALDEVSVIKLRLEKAINHLQHVFDEESEAK